MQHVPYEKLGHIEDWLARQGHGLATWQPFDGQPVPRLDTFDVLFIMGGPMNIYSHDENPWLVDAKHFAQQALDAGKPCVGICFGAQLLADRLGGAVTKNPEKEIGWWPVYLTDAGRQAPALAGWGGDDVGKPFDVFHWHGDTFALPPGVESLIESPACKHQAFTARNGQVLAFQFHPELSPDQLENWLADGEEPPAAKTYVQTPAQMRERPERFGIVNGWLEKTLAQWLSQTGAGHAGQPGAAPALAA